MEKLFTQDTLFDIIARYKQTHKKNRVTQPFQLLALEVADKLNDRKNIGLYMRLAKNKPRTHIERALTFVLDMRLAKNKAKLFLWKLKQLRLEQEEAKIRKGQALYGQDIQ